jgi:outer membrane protein TolC
MAFNQGRPQLQITQSLWRNWLGSETRATIDSQQAQALATSFSQSYQGRVILSQAEIAYWNLALYRSTVTITQSELDRAQQLYDVNSRKAHLGLADESDRLQAEAQLKLRKLQLESARDNERSAAQTFNEYRGVIAPTVAEQVQPLESDRIIQVEVPARAKMREDVRAAMEQSRASDANAQLGREKATPTFEVYGSVGPAAEELSPGSTVIHSFALDQLEREAGVRLSVPLNFGVMSESRNGFAKEQAGADLIYQRKVFEQENDWDDLNRKLSEYKTQLELSRSVELAQKEKLHVERDRLSRGRTTTFNVVQFEQDYLQAQLSVVQAQAQVLQIIAQMKTFGGPL